MIAAPAAASVLSLGNSAAKSCFMAADSLSMPTREQLAACDEAISGEPLAPHDLVATHVNRGILLLRRGDIDGSVRDFDKAIALDPNQAEAYLNKGAALIKVGNAQGALPLFSVALQKNTQRPALAYYGRGVANEELGNIRSAYLDYKKASENAPKWDAPKQDLSRFRVNQK
ncbi:MAG TPA: tetratricopeptide repeat protein [Allosphingosinicella sp.]|uniref:tetratricopeptide repeat protein n=1 Tax=Allosphingosinicella sp. TaxID=2823234 RepID=UPI002ED830FF